MANDINDHDRSLLTALRNAGYGYDKLMAYRPSFQTEEGKHQFANLCYEAWTNETLFSDK